MRPSSCSGCVCIMCVCPLPESCVPGTGSRCSLRAQGEAGCARSCVRAHPLRCVSPDLESVSEVHPVAGGPMGASPVGGVVASSAVGVLLFAMALLQCRWCWNSMFSASHTSDTGFWQEVQECPLVS